MEVKPEMNTESHKDAKVRGRTGRMYSEEEIMSGLELLLKPMKAAIANLDITVTKYVDKLKNTAKNLQ